MGDEHSFAVVDVFTDRALSGNPVAVFPRADDLPPHTMQAIAREFGFSETTFVMAPRHPAAVRRLRCFSPAAEVFGAGHNALGAWWLLAVSGQSVVPTDGVVAQELGDQVLPVVVTLKEGRVHRVTMQQLMPTIEPQSRRRHSLASALGLSPDEMHPALEPAVSSTGATRHLLAPVVDEGALARSRVDSRALVAVAREVGCEGCYAFCIGADSDSAAAHARGFFPGIGITEDAATGSAAGPLGLYLVQRELAPIGQTLIVEQGAHLHRRSRIEVFVDETSVHVGGSCVVVMSGQLRL
jgi:PhzF family phenazine biosynthesis protein